MDLAREPPVEKVWEPLVYITKVTSAEYVHYDRKLLQITTECNISAFT